MDSTRSTKDLIKGLLAKREDLLAEMRGLHERINATSNEVHAAQLQFEWESKSQECNDLGERASNLTAMLEHEEYASSSRKRFATTFNRSNKTMDEKRVEQFLRGNTTETAMEIPLNAESHVLKAGTSPGSETVPTGFGAFIQAYVAQSGVLQTNARQLTTTSGENLIIPKATAFGSANLITEGSSITASDPTLAQVTVGAYKVAAFMQASREVVEDSAVDINSFVGSSLGKAIGAATAQYLVSGTGSAQPQGIANAGTAGVTLAAGQTTTITSADSLVDLYFSVAAPYRRDAYWLMNSTTMALVRKLKASTAGTYILDFNSADAVPRILGSPVIIDEYMASPAANALTIAYGDFSEYLLIRQVQGVRIERSDDFAFQTDLVSYRGILRVDSKQTLNGASGAVKFLKQSAT